MTTSMMNAALPVPASLYGTRQVFVAMPAAPVRARVFDGAALALLPRIASAFGYRTKVGRTAEIRRDAAFVVTNVLGADGLLPPADIAWYGQRYDDATTWVVAYFGSVPVGALGILDPKVASVGLELTRSVAPAELRPERTRELGRLAIVRHHQSSPNLLVAMLHAALSWGLDNDLKHFFAAADPRLEGLLRVLAPSLQTLQARADTTESPVRERYCRKAREAMGPLKLVAFALERTHPWRLLCAHLVGGLRRFARPSEPSLRAMLHLVRG